MLQYKLAVFAKRVHLVLWVPKNTKGGDSNGRNFCDSCDCDDSIDADRDYAGSAAPMAQDASETEEPEALTSGSQPGAPVPGKKRRALPSDILHLK